MASLEASHSVALNVALDTSTPTAKLGSAAAHDNDRFINSEGDRQQLLLRLGQGLLLPMDIDHLHTQYLAAKRSTLKSAEALSPVAQLA